MLPERRPNGGYRTCNAGQGACPENVDCVGAWGTCGTVSLFPPISLSGKFDYEKKIKERLLDFIKFINKEYYKFDIDRTIDEEITLVEYGEGNHINWHSDIGLGELSRRKLSCVIQLNNSEEYDEGNLQFFNKSTDVEKMRKKGAGIIFPSFLQHRVTEITKGQRNVLVCFMHGQPFK